MIHVAGPYDRANCEQRCVRCDALVAVPYCYTVDVETWNQAKQQYDVRPAERRMRGQQWPEGALVEVGQHGACMVLALDATANCTAKAASEAA